MRRFERRQDGALEAQFEQDEAELLQSLAGQVAELVTAGALRQAQGAERTQEAGRSHRQDPAQGAGNDPALARLLPDAYPGDVEASAEFRRFTVGGLAVRKLQNADTLISTLNGITGTGTVSLDDTEALAWLRCLTDIRLTIASRLGIDSEDDDAGRDIDPLMREIYDWLGFVQNSLIEALDTGNG